MLDLVQIPHRFIEKYGREKLAEVCGQSHATVSMWLSKKSFPVTAVQALLDADPEPIHAIKPLYESVELGKKLIMLVPMSGPPQPKMMESFARLYDRHEMDFRFRSFNAIHVIRNAMAAEVLRGPWEWTFWNDADNVHPAGDPLWYKQAVDLPSMPDVYAGMNTIYRLLHHKLKRGLPANIVSTCYVSRQRAAIPQFGGGSSADMRAAVRRGPRDELKEVPWVPFGGVLVHRSVFEDIIKTQGPAIELSPNSAIGQRFNYRYAFFHPESPETPGDDLPFCRRAAEAGHKCYVDLAVMSAHGTGDRLFTYADVA